MDANKVHRENQIKKNKRKQWCEGFAFSIQWSSKLLGKHDIYKKPAE
jgi:hypothetical protein